jgi:hypothetical protein
VDTTRRRIGALLVATVAATVLTGFEASLASPSAADLLRAAWHDTAAPAGVTVNVANYPNFTFSRIEVTPHGWMAASGDAAPKAGIAGSRALDFVAAYRVTVGSLERTTPAQAALTYGRAGAAALLALAMPARVPLAQRRTAATALGGHWFSWPTISAVDENLLGPLSVLGDFPQHLVHVYVSAVEHASPAIVGRATVDGVAVEVIKAGALRIDVSTSASPRVVEVVDYLPRVGSSRSNRPPARFTFQWGVASPVVRPRATPVCAVFSPSAARGLEAIAAPGTYASCAASGG